MLQKQVRAQSQELERARAHSAALQEEVERLRRIYEPYASCTRAPGCWYAALGSSTANADGIDYRPSASMCEAATVNWGKPSIHSSAFVRRHHGEPIEIVVFGGSISCGNYVPTTAFGHRNLKYNHPDGTDAKRGKVHAWPRLLQDVLLSCWGAGSVVVRNECRPYTGSDGHLERLASGRVNVSNADAILVETATNDNEDYQRLGRAESDVLGFNEALARILLALPRRPYLLWLTAGWKSFQHGKGVAAETEQARVTRHYALPHVSWLNSLQPVEKDDELVKATTTALFQDCCHPTKLGHKHVAAIVAHRMLKQLDTRSEAHGVCQLPMQTSSVHQSPISVHCWPLTPFVNDCDTGGVPLGDDDSPFVLAPWHQAGARKNSTRQRLEYAPSYLTRLGAELAPRLSQRALARGPALHLDFSEAAANATAAAAGGQGATAGAPYGPASHLVVDAERFALGAGAAGKPGLVGAGVGSRLVLQLPQQASRGGGSVGSGEDSAWIALVSLLHSYHHMGTLEVRVLTSSAVAHTHEGCVYDREAVLAAEAATRGCSNATIASTPTSAPKRAFKRTPTALEGTSGHRSGHQPGFQPGLWVSACSRVDLLWHLKVTTMRAVHVLVPPSHPASARLDGGRGRVCHWVSLTVVASSRPRAHNEVVLRSLTIV